METTKKTINNEWVKKTYTQKVIFFIHEKWIYPAIGDNMNESWTYYVKQDNIDKRKTSTVRHHSYVESKEIKHVKKATTMYKRTPIRRPAYFSTETLQARMEWHNIFKSDEREEPTTKNTLTSKTLLQIWWRNQKLSRPGKIKRIQHHQTGFTTNAKETSLGRKHKRRKRPTENKPETIKEKVIESCCVLCCQSCPTLCSGQAPLSVEFSRQVASHFSRRSSRLRDQTQISTLQADSLPSD